MATEPLKAPAIGTNVPRPAGQSPKGVQPGALDPGSGRKSATTPEAIGGDSGEKVQISKAARELLRQSELMGQARETLDSHPGIRSDRVAEVRARLEAGVYDTKAVKDELADRLTTILGDLPYRNLLPKGE